jgi:hypothetical protein
MNSKWIKNLNEIPETETSKRKQGKHFKTLVQAIIFWARPRNTGNKGKN